MQTQTMQEPPRYRLLGACFLEDDMLHVEGEEIIYLGVPNEEMEPLNETAKVASLEYMTALDDAARATAAYYQRPFNGRMTDRNEALGAAMDDALKVKRGQIVLPTASGPVPIRSDLMTPAQRKLADARKPKKVLGTKAPPKGPAAMPYAPPKVLGNVPLPNRVVDSDE